MLNNCKNQPEGKKRNVSALKCNSNINLVYWFKDLPHKHGTKQRKKTTFQILLNIIKILVDVEERAYLINQTVPMCFSAIV